MKPLGRPSNAGQLVEFGFSLPTRGALIRPTLLAQLARTAETLHYACVTISDHVVLPTRTSAPYPYSASGEFPGGARQNYLEPLALMGWLLGATKRIQIGISVLVVPYRNPVVTAKQIATLDVLSGGRVILGVGVGWWPEEFQALAAPPFAERGAVTDEYLRLMKELWTADEPRFVGKYYRAGDITCLPKPARKPHPPIWVGGHTHRALRRAAELGDAWHPIGVRETITLAPDEVAAKAGRLRAEAARVGRDPGSIRIAFRAPLDLWPPKAKVGPDAPLLSGPPAKVVNDIRAYQRAGVRTFVFDFPQPSPKLMVATMARFARDVRPKVARAPR